MTTAPKFVPDNNTPAAAPPEVPQWSEPMRYDVPQSNGCAGCPRLFVGTKWVGEICGAVYLGHNSVKYAERIVALWNDDIARHAPQPEAQPATETACLRAILDVFGTRIGGRAFTMNEVAEWAEREGLYPTPKRGDPPAAFDDFLKRLDAVRKRISAGQ